MAKGCRKCKPTECEECPEWIFTLADLIMCMMGLFVILWVLKPEGSPANGNSADKQEYIKMAAAIRDAFGYIPDPLSKDPVDIQMIQQKLRGERVPQGPGEGSKIQRQDQATDGEDPEVQNIRDGKANSAGTTLLFEAGSSVPPTDAVKKARDLAAQFKGYKHIVIIKGHTALDDVPEDATDQDKMDISLARAKVVADLLAREGISREVLRVQGCSTYEPARKRVTSQAPNRRVEIEVTDQLVEDRQDRPKTIPAAKPKLSDN